MKIDPFKIEITDEPEGHFTAKVVNENDPEDYYWVEDERGGVAAFSDEGEAIKFAEWLRDEIYSERAAEAHLYDLGHYE